MKRLRVGRLAPGATAKLNLYADLILLLAAILFSTERLAGGTSHFAWCAVAASVAWLFTATALRHYDPWATDREPLDDAALASVIVMAVTTVLGLAKLVAPKGTPLPQVGTFLLIFWPTVIALRLFVFRRLIHREDPLDEVLILGTGPMGRATGSDLVARGRRRVIGYLRFPDEPRPAHLGNLFLGTTDEVETLLKSMAVSEVYIAGNTVKQAEGMQRAIKSCEKFGIPFALPAYSFRLDRAQPHSRAVADGYLHYQCGALKPHQMALKRLFDILVTAVAMWLLLPLLVTTAALIKLTSRGPIFFKQVRVGLRGKPFRMLKFRSMVVNAEEMRQALESQNEQSGPVFKVKNDPRITMVGRFIRKYSIDELPQLINVLRGDMSIVGPRPPIPSEVVKYEPWQRRRLSVRPGLTCLWQVSGRNQVSFEDWMYLDMQYIDHWSLIQDFNLILRTVPVVLTGRGAS
jgi:exopolysaccharide biosynthesis polyprenyl glycosylphosphotransferase